MLVVGTATGFASSSATLSQAANGTFNAPVSPVTWQSGNLNQNSSHYFEGQSAAYRLVMTGLTPGPHVVVIEWDIVNSSRNAIDYLTYYRRIAEQIDPLSGLSGSFSAPMTVQIPTPIPSLMVNGAPEPQTSFNALLAGERLMTIYNGSITSLSYINNSQGNLGDLTASQSSSDLQIQFTATNSTVVLAWGGHIASRLDWGVGHSAAGISGSPYHTRLIALDGSGGNQDRSLKATAVCSPPTNSLSGPGQVCQGSSNTYVDLSDAALFQWTVSGNATLVGPTTNASVQVIAGTGGSYTLTVTTSASGDTGGCRSTAAMTVGINPLPSCSISGSAQVCPSSLGNLYLAPPGMAAYSWALSGSGSIVGPSNAPTVSLTAGSQCGQSFTLTLNVVDTNGCTSTCTQNVTVSDTSAPVFSSFPADVVVECPGLTLPPETGVPTATDTCSVPSVSFADVSVDGNCSNQVIRLITRTWTATDACGNSTNRNQLITLKDTTPPTFVTFPPDTVVECPNSTAPAVTGQPTGTDTCSVVSISFSDVSVDGDCSNQVVRLITRTWTVTDACGNSFSQNQLITLKDTRPPSFVAFPADVVVECPNPTTPTETGQPSGTDTCSVVSISFSDVSVDGNCSNQVVQLITRTWTATDACGNSISQNQVISVKDTTPPSFATFPLDTVVECPNSTAPPATGQPTGTDTCSVVSISFSDVSVDGNCSNQVVRLITRTWTAADACGNSISQNQLITVKDTTAPSFALFPPDEVVECPNSTAPPATGQPLGTDTCSVVSISFSDVSLDGNCSNQVIRLITRSWTVTDACGNNLSQNQLITVKDTTPPSFVTFPPDAVVECPNPTTPAATGQPTATDTCSVVSILFSDLVAGGNCSNQVVQLITRTWTATDACGNSFSQNQLISLKDTTPPQIMCQSDIIVAESPPGSGGATVSFPPAVATDTCDSTPLVSSTPASGSFFPVGTNTVICTATDACGNTNTCSFKIWVISYQLAVNNLNDSGPGSLRQAMLDANASPEPNLVAFNLPGSGPYVIHLLSQLPEITSPLVLDGWSQLGSNGPPVIGLDGSTGNSSIDGLVLTTGSNTVRGLVLTGFANGLRVQGTGYNIIQGNFIGTDFTGTNLVGNSANGIYVDSPGNLVGGVTAGTANIIARNQRNGIALALTAGLGNAMLGNSIFSNGALGIDLGNDGITLNGSSGTNGPNGFQAFPVITNAECIDGATTTVEGLFAGQPFASYRLEFFLNDTANPSGYGEGQTSIGSIVATLDGSGLANFTASFPVTALATQYVTATATDLGGDTSEFSANCQVQTPPVIVVQPVSIESPPGSPTTFCGVATGTRPLTYQWRLNGINIPGATDRCYTIPDAEVAQGGTYTLLVANRFGAVASATVTLTLTLPPVPPGDNFADRVTLSGPNGLITGRNIGATSEPGEPLHAGKPGGKSVWYTWTAPFTGIVSMRTSGSTFSTLLAVYAGSVLTNLTAISSDVSHAGFYNSLARFNVFQGNQYQIAIDGFGGDSGTFVLDWQEQDTSHMLPIFLVQPVSQTVGLGQNATFSAVGARVCGNGQINCSDPNPQQLLYQWCFYGSPIPGATTNTLAITNVQPSMLGVYTLRLYTPFQTNESQNAILQINQTADVVEQVQANDLFLDSVDSNPLLIGVFSASAADGPDGPPSPTPSTVVSGYSGTQIFNTGGAGTTPTETICGVIGGASEWISFVPQSSGTMFLNTDGSSYDTVMAVFRRSPTNAAVLQLIRCDNNSGSNHITSAMAFPVTAGVTNYVDVDGVGGATGILQFNYSLITSTTVKSLGLSVHGAPHLQIVGRPGMRFTLQASRDLVNWVPVVTTNSLSGTFDFEDPFVPVRPWKFYRALMLP
jgi:uncharacterized protein affecting Mg2+/Co2+ transport